MARFDVYANPDAGDRKQTPFFVDVQNDYIDTLASRVVIPLRRLADFGRPARNLNPVLQVVDASVVLDTASMAAVATTELRKPVANLHAERALIQEALDTLFGAH